MSATVVSHVPAHNRFEIHLGGVLAGFVDYQVIDGTYALMHTQVLPEFGGRGVGSTLIVETLQQLRGGGHGVLPYCSFIPQDHPRPSRVPRPRARGRPATVRTVRAIATAR